MGGKRSAGLRALLVPIALSAAGPAVAQQQAAPPSAAPSPTQAIIVLDGSKTMWSKIGGQGKVPLVRAALGQALGDYKDKIAFGLVAFGHGSAAACADIEVRAKPGELTASSQGKILLNFKPQISKPIGAALTEAARAGPAGGQFDLILITDGADNCKIDVCATAKAIKQAAPSLRMHVLGFAAKPDNALKAFSCVAEATGGTFVTASNANELKQGLTSILDAAATPEPAAATAATTPEPQAPPAAPAAEAAPAPAAEAAPASAAPVASSASAPAAATSTAVPAPAVSAPQAAADAPTESAEARAPPAETTAPAGPQTPGESEMQKSLAASPLQALAPSPSQPPLPAAAPAAPSLPVPVTFKALLTEAGPRVDNGVTWRVFTGQPGPNGARKLISTHREAMPTEALLPGEYLVNAAYGLSNLTKQIKVRSGQSLDETFILNCGGLKLAATLVSGEQLPAGSVHFDILSDEEDQFGNRREVLGDAKPGVIIRLNAGAYHIVSTYGNANATVRADVTVEPGKITEATVKHAAATVTFKLVQSAGGEALADTKWSILTATGDVVTESTGALPTHILAAGDYAAMANHNGETYTTKFNVAAGQARQIEVVMEQGPTSAEELRAITNPPPPPPPGTAEPEASAPDSGMALDGTGATPQPPAPGGLINPGVLLRPRLP